MERFRMSSLLKQLQKEAPPLVAPVVKNPIKRRRSKKEPKPQVKSQPQIKSQPQPQAKKKQKQRIPAALREQVWIYRMGRVFEGKCPTTWCQNNLTVFDFQSGHNIPESKGGPTTLENLIPLCARCNLSMGNDYTFEEWCRVSNPPSSHQVEEVPRKRTWRSFFCLE
jgi:5-methylcytosine-specific restriction endonuclease McrA